MARPPRVQIPDAVYHVSARGNERGSIYRDDDDRLRFLELLETVAERYSWRILSYCLMTNHYHLLLQTPLANLAAGMRQLNGVYAQSFNRRHGRVGHLLQGRYAARLVQADEHLLAAARYIVRNPVRAGMCRRPEEWRWSSHRALLGLERDGSLHGAALLDMYGGTRAQARERYRAHCEREDEAGERSTHPLALGDDAFIAAVVEGVTRVAGIPKRYLQPPRADLRVLLASQDAGAMAAAHAHGYSLREIGRYLGISAATVSRRLRRHRMQDQRATLRT